MLLITGASGLLGPALVRGALAAGRPVRAMVREGSTLDFLADVRDRIDIVRADMGVPESLGPAVEGVSAVVHAAATTSSGAPDLELSRKTNVEGTRALIAAMNRAGVRRLISIGSQSAHPKNESVYGKTKYEQRQVVTSASEVDWTLLRPNVLYGAAETGLFHKIVSLCRKLPVIPVIGSGKEEMRPIHVDDVATAVLECLDGSATIGKVYNLDGPEHLEFNEFLRAILRSIGKKKMLFHLPIPIAMGMARTMSLVMKNPPITPDNVIGLKTTTYDDTGVTPAAELGLHPRGFSEGLAQIFGGGETA